jgi:D-alanine-D-alanine ligase
MTIRVHVLIGGPSVEHEVSLSSGLQVLRRLDKKRYQPAAVVITHGMKLFFSDRDINALTPEDCAEPSSLNAFEGPFSPAASGRIWNSCDVAFLALHGTFGEDGVVQGYLDTLGVSYTGSGVFASAVAMEKIASKFLFFSNGLAVPPWSIFGKAFPEVTLDYLEKKHGFPCFIKCPQSGSSRLMGRAANRSDLAKLVRELEPHASRLLIETAIHGIEFSCGVIENESGEPYALPPVEIRPAHGPYFDYSAKYTAGESEELVPAPRSVELLDRIKAVALHAHAILNCRGVSRTDMIYADDTLFVLETNTLPGLTPNSLLPKAFIAAGGTYEGLLDTLIRAAMRQKKPRPA